MGSFLTATNPVTSSDFMTVIESITGQISVSTVVGVLGTAAGAGIGLVFMWWGVRKVARSLMGAFRSGKLPL